jgi:hypothetical protein
MRRKLFILFFILFTNGYSFAQIPRQIETSGKIELTKWMTGKFSYFNLDAIGNLYVINENGQIKKYDSYGDSSQVFQDVKKWGRPNYMDVSNPLKVRVFFPDYLAIVTLDRLMNPRTTLSLRKNNHFRVKGIATSYDNHLWVYDEQLCRIFKMDDDGNLLLESADLRNLTGQTPSDIRLTDRNGEIYMFDAKSGIFILDYYGAFKKRIPEMFGNNGGIDREYAYVFEGETLKMYNIKDQTIKDIALNGFVKNNEPALVFGGMLYVLKKDGIYRCSLN